jgi:hypothetical protein
MLNGAEVTTRVQGRVLWRLQGPTRIVAASLRPIAKGFELRVGYEPHGVGKVLSRETASGLFASRRLEQRARRLRDALASHGWTLLAPSRPMRGHSRATWSTIGLVAAAAGLAGTAGWMRRRHAAREALSDCSTEATP